MNQNRHKPAFAESPLEAPDRVLQRLPACRLEPPKQWWSLARRADLAHANPGLTAEGDRLCETRIDTNSCLLILEPGLLWPGFRKAPAARGSPRRLGSPLSTRRGPCGAPDRRGPDRNWKNMGSCQSWFNIDLHCLYVKPRLTRIRVRRSSSRAYPGRDRYREGARRIGRGSARTSRRSGRDRQRPCA